MLSNLFCLAFLRSTQGLLILFFLCVIFPFNKELIFYSAGEGWDAENELTVFAQGISTKFSSIFYERLKGQILVHNATTIVSNPSFFLIMDYSRGDNDHT